MAFLKSASQNVQLAKFHNLQVHKNSIQIKELPFSWHPVWHKLGPLNVPAGIPRLSEQGDFPCPLELTAVSRNKFDHETW